MIRITTALLLAFATAGVAGLPVVPAADQSVLLQSSSPKLAANKKLVYDFFRVILRGRRLEQTADYMLVSYIQHNPQVETGMKGFIDFFSHLPPHGPQPIPATVAGLVAIQAEGEYVTLSFVDEHDDPVHPGKKYTTTWFDMFRIEDGKLAEHWDNDTLSAATPAAPAAERVRVR